jgi:hypothetical protein
VPVWLSSQASQARINLAGPHAGEQPGQFVMVFNWLLMHQIQNIGIHALCLVVCIQYGGLTTSLEWCAYHHLYKGFYTCATNINQTKLDYNNFEIKKPITTTTTTVMTTINKMRNK